MSKFLPITSVSILALLFSCKKQDGFTSPPEKKESLQKSAQKEFEPCSCSEASKNGGEYIKADIDDVTVCFDVQPNLGDTFPNMYKYGYILRDTGLQYYDNLYMIRNARTGRWQAALFFENTHASTKTYPYRLPRPNSDYCEIGELQINDLYNYVSCAWCPENKYNYYAQFWNGGVSMIATSFDNNIFQGTFEGTVRTGSGKFVPVKNGSFRIKLVTYRSDIKIN